MGHGPFCPRAVGLAHNAAGVEPLEKLFDRDCERHITALRSLIAQFHRVHDLRIHFPAERHQAHPRTPSIRAGVKDQNPPAFIFCRDKSAADLRDGDVFIPFYEPRARTLV
jgi:hypothetical protein